MTVLRGEWLVPFQGRNDSGADRQNFLWRDGSIYVMRTMISCGNVVLAPTR